MSKFGDDITRDTYIDFLHKYDTIDEYESIRKVQYNEPWVSLTIENNSVNYNAEEGSYEWYVSQPLTMKILSDGTISWKLINNTVQYSKNDGDWTDMNSGTSISVTDGDVVKFKGTNTDYYNNYFQTTCSFNLEGNILSLLNGKPNIIEHCFGDLFRNCTGLIDASNFVLPATTLAFGCYANMFQGCTNLVTAPELPATTLAENCYDGMFKACTSLVNAPSTLPATTLKGSCYEYMFRGCTSLVTAPVLPATTLAYGCYAYMFWGCTSLVNAPELPVTTLEDSCYRNMFYSCTNLVNAPELPATTLEEHCYAFMFNGCTKLKYVKCLATDISASSCTYNWLSNVSSTGTFVRPSSMTGWGRNASGIPTGWAVQNA